MPANESHSPATLLLTVLLTACAAPKPSFQPPDILLLVIDCLRADRYGGAEPYSRPATPNLDRLVAEGIRFTNTFSQASWTRPSLPTFLTGLYPSEHGLVDLARDGGRRSGRSLSLAAVTVAEALRDRGYATTMVGEQTQLAPRFRLDQGFDHYNHKGSRADSIHFDFLGWRNAASRPYFAYLHYLELHWPYCPPEAVRGRFTPDWEGRSFCFQWRKLRDELRSGAIELDDDEIEAMRGRYDEELLGLDMALGELFAALEERGEWGETMIILTSDHGEEFFEHGGMGHGSSLHDELVRVPLVIKPPASWPIPAGAVVDALVELRDLAPTLMEVAGAPAPAIGRGQSLLPWLQGERPLHERQFVTSEDLDSVAVRTTDLKLIARRDGSGLDLYDLRADPGETQSVADSRPGDVSRLRGMLRQWSSSLVALPGEETALDEETVEELKALGYLND